MKEESVNLKNQQKVFNLKEREAMKKMNKASETTSSSSILTHVKKNPRRRRERANKYI